MLLQDGLKIIEELQDEQQTALDSIARGEQQQAVALLYGPVYEQEMERAQSQIDHFRQILDKRIIADVQAATKTSKALRTVSEVMVGLTALLFLFVMGFILKRRVLHPVVRLSDVVHRLASQDYAVETPNFTQIDEIGDMAQAIRIFRENGLVRQQLEKERDADWAIRELLARMTQRLKGCENLADVINVAELFAPNIAPGVSGRLYIFDREPWQMRCAAEWLSPEGDTPAFHPDECRAVRRGQSHPPVNGEPDIGCYHLPESQAHRSCAFRSLRRAKPSACSLSRTSPLKPPPPALILNLWLKRWGWHWPTRSYAMLYWKKRSSTRSRVCVTVITWKIRCGRKWRRPCEASNR